MIQAINTTVSALILQIQTNKRQQQTLTRKHHFCKYIYNIYIYSHKQIMMECYQFFCSLQKPLLARH